MTSDYIDEVKKMMRVFYASPCLLTNGSEEIFENDINNCIGDSPYLEGYVFLELDKVVGYAMIAKSFSTEFGKPCIWIEDIFFKPNSRRKGFGSKFFSFLENKYPNCIFRLEAEKENEAAIRAYKKYGFSELPYFEMKK